MPSSLAGIENWLRREAPAAERASLGSACGEPFGNPATSGRRASAAGLVVRRTGVAPSTACVREDDDGVGRQRAGVRARDAALAEIRRHWSYLPTTTLPHLSHSFGDENSNAENSGLATSTIELPRCAPPVI